MSITSRNELAAAATTVEQRLATAVFDTELAAVAPQFHVRWRWRRHTRFVNVSWYGAPTDDAVRAFIGPVDEDVTLRLHRTQLWSCGRVHDDDMEAWTAHEGTDELTWVCGCGSTDVCESDAPDCRWFGERVLIGEREDELRAEGETFTSWCVPSERHRCAVCRDGRIVDQAGRAVSSCTSCDGSGTFDLTGVALREAR